MGAWCKINFEWDSNPLTIAHRLSQNHTRNNQLIIPSGVTSIGKYVFDGLHEVYKVDLNKDLKSIGDYAFNDCVDMTQLVIPENVDEIGDGITAGCIGLTYLSVKDNETYDSRNDCNAIIDSKTDVLKAGCKNTIIPNNVKGIGKSAFENCTELKSATIPDGATFIGDKAFYGCTNLTSMSVPNSINHIGESSFQHCSLSEVNIPENIDSIGSSTFAQCPNLKKVNIPNKVKFIGAVAFASCNSLESVIIGENVDSISSHAFVDCTALKTVYCYAEKVPGTYDNVFESSTSDAILYVPEKSLDLYKSMAPWNEFKEILPITQTGIEYVENKDATESQYYTLDGRVHKTKKKGINIIRMNNGKTKKIVVK